MLMVFSLFFCLAAELEFVQIIIIIVVMTVMVVVIICLLNHYRLSAWAFLTRHSQARQREEGMQPVSVCVFVGVLLILQSPSEWV